MVVAQCSGCGAQFSLKDEFAGKKARCPNCSEVFDVPGTDATVVPASSEASETAPAPEAPASFFAPPTPAATDTPKEAGAFSRHEYGIKQKKITLLSERYYIRDEHNADILFAVRDILFLRSLMAAFAAAGVFFAVAAALLGNLEDWGAFQIVLQAFVAAIAAPIAAIVFFILKPKRNIRFCTDEGSADNDASEPVFTVTQERQIEFPHMRYELRLHWEKAATFEKNVFTNIFRRKWWITLENGRRFVVKEDSIILSLLRRWAPTVGSFIRATFVFYDLQNDPEQKRPIGSFVRKMELFDNYRLSLANDPAFSLPRPVAIGMAVLLDTGEKR